MKARRKSAVIAITLNLFPSPVRLEMEAATSLRYPLQSSITTKPSIGRTLASHRSEPYFAYNENPLSHSNLESRFAFRKELNNRVKVRMMKTKCDCRGWWEQSHFGRQWMHDLEIFFEDESLHGTGVDIIGAFQIRGLVSPDGTVKILKQYLGAHSVTYIGTSDGEGTMSGGWNIDSHIGGRWSINYRATENDCDAIEEIRGKNPQ